MKSKVHQKSARLPAKLSHGLPEGQLQSVAWLLHQEKSLPPNTPGLSGFYSSHSPTLTLLTRHKLPKTASPDEAQHDSALLQWGYLWQVGKVWLLPLWALKRWQLLLSWGSSIPETPASLLTLWLPQRGSFGGWDLQWNRSPEFKMALPHGLREEMKSHGRMPHPEELLPISQSSIPGISVFPESETEISLLWTENYKYQLLLAA